MNTTQFLMELTSITGDKSPSITWININGTLELHTKVVINNEDVHDLSQRTGGPDVWNYDGIEEIFFSTALDVMRKWVEVKNINGHSPNTVVRKEWSNEMDCYVDINGKPVL